MGFEKYTNYNEHAGVSSVVFGSEKPLLEVELNEMQEIQKTYLRNTIKNIIGNGITDKSKITYKDGTLSVESGCAFAVDGYIIECTGLSIVVSSGTVYLQVWEETANSDSILFKDGNNQEDTVDNYFKDSRFPVETTRRKVIRYDLTLTPDGTKHNLPVASVNTNGTFTRSVIKEISFEKLSNKVIDLQNYMGLYGDDVFGVEVDLDNNTVKRVGQNEFSTAGNDYNGLSIYGNRKRCNVTDDGHIIAYYGDEYYTETGALTVSVTVNDVTYPVGTKVQCMVYQPKFYYRRIPLRLTKQVDTNYNVTGYHLKKWIDLISPVYKEGFKLHPAFKRGDTELEGYLIGENDGCIENSSGVYDLTNSETPPASPYTGYKFSSIAGAKPTTSNASREITTEVIRQMCANRGSNGWQQLDITILSAEQMLFLIEYATFNIQETLLGSGNTEFNSSTINYSVANPNNTTLGNGSGVLSTEITVDSTNYTVNVPVYRGVKNPYGNVWKYVEGLVMDNTVSDPKYAVFFNNNAPFTGNISDFTSCGFSCALDTGYIKYFAYSEDYDFLYIPSAVGGDSLSPVGDSFNKNPSEKVLTGVSGGYWSSSSSAGLFCFTFYSPITPYNINIGGRLCKK